MSTGGDEQSLGRAKIEIVADTSGFEEGVKNSKESVEDFSSSAEDNISKIRAEMDKLTEAMKKPGLTSADISTLNNGYSTLATELGKAATKAKSLKSEIKEVQAVVSTSVAPAIETTKVSADALWNSMKTGAVEATAATEGATVATTGLSTGLSALASGGATAAILAIGLIIKKWSDSEEAAKAARDAFQKAYEASEKSREKAGDVASEATSPKSRAEKEQEELKAVFDKAFEDQRKQLLKLGNAKDETYKRAYQKSLDLEEEYQQASAAIKKRYADKENNDNYKVIKEALDAAAVHERELAEQKAKDAADLQKILRESQADYIAWQKRVLEMEERIAETRIRGIIDAERAWSALAARQEQGFTAQDGGASLAGQIQAMTDRIVSAVSSSGGAVN